MTKREKRNLALGLAFTGPWIVGFSAFTLYPALASFAYSLCDYSVLTKPVFIGLGNYRDLFTDQVYWKSVFNTFFYALLYLPLGTLFSLGLALLLNTGVRGQALYRTLFFLPSVIPMISMAILWLWMFNPHYGLVNHALALVGLPGPQWLQDPHWIKPAFALMGVWTVGNAVVIYLAALQDVPRSLYEAAELDGAQWHHKIRHVTLPMISPAIFFNVVMGLIATLQVFAVPYVMTFPVPGQPARSALFYTMYLYESAFRYLRMGYACAMAVVMFLIILGLTWLFMRLSKRHVHYRGS
ncbi:MAG TPA: sugar ABC transporter permease [bacterium]|nr:sugar ABC transporter permease [bacterium]